MSVTLPWSGREVTVVQRGGWASIRVDGQAVLELREDSGKWVYTCMQQNLDRTLIHPFWSQSGERQISGWAEGEDGELDPVVKGYNWQRWRTLPVYVANPEHDSFFDVP